MYVVNVPRIEEVYIDANPATKDTTLFVRVRVIEVEKELDPYFCGDLYCGEVSA